MVGLLGMVVGEQMINTARHHLAPASTPIAQSDDARPDPHGLTARQRPNRMNDAARSP
nr:XapX domain-containing protein [Bradyrhizobium sp. th.b2]